MLVNSQNREHQCVRCVALGLSRMQLLLFVPHVLQGTMHYQASVYAKHVQQESMRKEGLRSVMNANQEPFPMPLPRLAPLVPKECTPILAVLLVKDVQSNNSNDLIER